MFHNLSQLFSLSKAFWKSVQFGRCSHYHCLDNSVGLGWEWIKQKPISGPWKFIISEYSGSHTCTENIPGSRKMVPLQLILGISVGPPSLPYMQRYTE